MINDRRATVVRCVWRCRRRRSLNRYLLFNIAIWAKLTKGSRTKGSRIFMLMMTFRFVVLLFCGEVNLTVRATLYPVLPGRYRIQHLSLNKLD